MATRLTLDQFTSEAILARLNWRLSRSDLPEATREALTRDRDSRLRRQQENYQAVSPEAARAAQAYADSARLLSEELLRSASDKPAEPRVFGPEYGPYGFRLADMNSWIEIDD